MYNFMKRLQGEKMLKDMIYTGLGMGVVLKEKVENEIEKLQKEGKLKKDDATSLLESLASKGKDEESKVKELLKTTTDEHTIKTTLEADGLKTIAMQLSQMLLLGETSLDEAIRIGLGHA